MAGILTDLTDGIRGLQRLNKELSELELKEEILNLKQLLLAAKEEIMAKDEQLKTLQTSIGKRSETVEVLGFRYDLVDGKPSGLPYYPTCEVREEKLYRLSKSNSAYSWCPNCNVTHNAASDGRVHDVPPPPPPIRRKSVF